MEAVNEKGALALHYMVKHPHCPKQSAAIHKALTIKPSLLVATTKYGETPLHAACLKGNHKVIPGICKQQEIISPIGSCTDVKFSPTAHSTIRAQRTTH